MPAGGLHCGTLYLGGDGRLWLWGIFNDDKMGIDPKTVRWNNGIKEKNISNDSGACYVEPAIANNKRVLAQGFAINIKYKGKTIIKELREEDWDEISFEATYPLATITYTDQDLPVKIVVTAGAFFIPLLAEDSGLPATSFSIQVQNTVEEVIDISITGWLENGANKITAKIGDDKRQNIFVDGENYLSVFSSFVANDDLLLVQRDAGTMSLALIGKDGIVNTAAAPYPVQKEFFTTANQARSEKDPDEQLIGSITIPSTTLAAKAFYKAEYVLSWHFNHTLEMLHEKMPESKQGHYYGALYKDAAAVTNYIGVNFERLRTQTLLWQQTFYDATLPHWFLERTFLNISTIATGTTYRFASGRFWGWEGVNACTGTCTHVWQYAQALSRIFPGLERDTRARVDLGVGMMENGGIIYRGEFRTIAAIDGQAGTILRFYREHQMSADNSFLKSNWMKMKKAINFMMLQDKDGDGMTDTPMENTLDSVYEGENAWIVGLCIAAAKASEIMAVEMEDYAFAEICGRYVEKGSKNMAEKLFNGEYFIHRPNALQGKKELGSYNTCHIGQVYGQSWAYQVGIGRLWDKDKTLSALRSLWKYNFAPDVGTYITTHPGGSSIRPGRRGWTYYEH